MPERADLTRSIRRFSVYSTSRNTRASASETKCRRESSKQVTLLMDVKRTVGVGVARYLCRLCDVRRVIRRTRSSTDARTLRRRSCLPDTSSSAASHRLDSPAANLCRSPVAAGALLKPVRGRAPHTICSKADGVGRAGIMPGLKARCWYAVCLLAMLLQHRPAVMTTADGIYAHFYSSNLTCKKRSSNNNQNVKNIFKT